MQLRPLLPRLLPGLVAAVKKERDWEVRRDAQPCHPPPPCDAASERMQSARLRDWDGEEVPPTRANLHAVMTRVMTKQVPSAASSHPPPPLASHR